MGAAALGAGEGGGQQRVRHPQQIRQLAGRHRGRRVPEHGAHFLHRGTRAGERCGATHDAGTARHGALHGVAQLRHVRARPPVGVRRPRRGRRHHLGAPDAVNRLFAQKGPQRAAGFRARRARRDALGQAGPEHHPFEQRVGGQPVGAVHPGAGHLSHRPQTGQRSGAPQVGHHATREMVGRRRDRQPVVLGVEADGRERGRNGREARREALESGGIEPEVIDALLGHAGGHGPAHHVTRRQLVHETLAVAVAQERAVPAQRLGEQGAGHGRVVQRGGVELDELHVGRRDAGPQRHRHAVAGRFGRVGGDREELAGTAGGQHDMVGLHRHRAVAAAGREGQHAGAAAPFDQQVEGEPALEHGAGRPVGGVDECPLHLGPGGGAAGVHDAGT